MKQPLSYRPLLCVAALLTMLTVVSTKPAYAQTEAAAQSAEAAQAPYSTEELELMRSKILELLDTVQAYSAAVTPFDTRSAESLAQARKQIERFSAKELRAFRAVLDPSKMNAELPQARETLEAFKPALQAAASRRMQNSLSKGMATSAGLPPVADPGATCEALIGAGRPSADLVTAADAVYVAAKVINAVADRACNQVVVAGVIILGEGAVGGGNTSSACIAADALLFVAENVHDQLEACDEDFTKRSVDAAVGRLSHLHADLEASVAGDNANKAAIVANDNTNKTAIVANSDANKTAIITNSDANKTAIITNAEANKSAVFTKIGDSATAIIANDDANKSAIVTNDNANKAAIVANDNANKDTIVANDNANKNTIVANDNANKDTIVANDNANATMLRNLIMRTQIEADLASADGATPVALFETPETQCAGAAPLNQCGLLDLVREIVVQTISRLAGAGAAQANAFLAKGDQYRAAGNFKAAYQQYRQAYKTAAR
jgi:hypothetical protein